jgi:hypothetical protein
LGVNPYTLNQVDSSDYANDAFSGFSALKILPGGLSAVAADPCKGMLHTFALGAGVAQRTPEATPSPLTTEL